MERKDFRSIGRDAQEALRERAVYLVLRFGKTQAEAAGLVGVHRQVVNRWIGRHRDEGAAGLRDGRRISSRKGSGILTAEGKPGACRAGSPTRAAIGCNCRLRCGRPRRCGN